MYLVFKFLSKRRPYTAIQQYRLDKTLTRVFVPMNTFRNSKNDKKKNYLYKRWYQTYYF